MKRILLLLIAVASFAAGCDRPIEIHSPDTASAPPAPSLADTPADSTKPATHDGAPQPEASTAAAPTARDTSANAPAETLTHEKEVNQMPMAGQANNHSSPAFEKGQRRRRLMPSRTEGSTT